MCNSYGYGLKGKGFINFAAIAEKTNGINNGHQTQVNFILFMVLKEKKRKRIRFCCIISNNNR